MSIAKFGYNTETNDDLIGWGSLGTKYNFNLSGKILGLYKLGDKQLLISQVNSSFGNNCTVGTIDVREVTIASEYGSSIHVLLSNNNISRECNVISIALSDGQTKNELSEGIPFEQTRAFNNLIPLGFNLEKEDVSFDSEVTVCGVEQVKFDRNKEASRNITR